MVAVVVVGVVVVDVVVVVDWVVVVVVGGSQFVQQDAQHLSGSEPQKLASQNASLSPHGQPNDKEKYLGQF